MKPLRLDFTAPTDEALQFIAEHMNPFDAQEVLASGGFTPIEALRDAVSRSYESFVVSYDGEPQAAFGIAMFDDDVTMGVPWLLATPGIRQWNRRFLQISSEFVEMWLERHEYLTNAVDMRHHEAHRWLLWLGFEPIAHYARFGKAGLPFIQFTKFRPDV